MSIHRRAAKRDSNEAQIVKTLRAHGCVVWLLSGTGITDLVVMRHGRTWLADVKMPGKYPTKPQEDLWDEAATKAHVSVFILRGTIDAVMMLDGLLPPWEQKALRGRTATGYTPPRQPPGDPREAEVFAPPQCGCIGEQHTTGCIQTGRYE